MADRAAELAYLEGIRALDEQRSALDASRSTAATALALAAVGTGFLATAALEEVEGMPALAWCAIFALLVTVAATGVAIWPGRWRFTLDPNVLAGGTWANREVDEVHRVLAGFLGDFLEKNSPGLRLRFGAVRVAVSFSAASLVLWTLQLGTGATDEQRPQPEPIPVTSVATTTRPTG